MENEINSILEDCKSVFSRLETLSASDRIDAINAIRLDLHQYSPMKNEPVDCVIWVPSEQVHANDYNPNAVAPPEMKLLERSITEDGYTQPVVAWAESPENYQVVDGYHRNVVGKTNKAIRLRTCGRLPLAVINEATGDRQHRMASTIRHNRARGTHSVDLMVNIVSDLVQSGMSDDWIAKNIGMDADELLRLKQISGLAALFKDRNFSRAWAANGVDEQFYQDTDDGRS